MSQPTAPAAAPAAAAPAVDAAPTPAPSLKVQSKGPADPDAAREAEYQAALKAARGGDQKPAKPAKGTRDESGRFQKTDGTGADEGQSASGDDQETEVTDAETSDDGEGGEEQAADGEGDEDGDQEEKKPAPKVKKYKVNGKEIEVDVGDERRVDQLIQKGLGADKAFADAAKVQKQAVQFLETLRDNPLALLTNPKLKIDPVKLRNQMEKFLYEQVRYETAPEDERRAMDERKELERLREKAQTEERAKEAAKRNQAKEDVIKRLTPMFIDAIEKADLPATDFTLRQMSHYMRLARAKGMKSITPADVAPLVARDFHNHQRQLYGRYDGQDLIKRVGEEHARKLIKAGVEQVKPGQSRQVKDPAPRAPVKAQPTKTPTFSSAEELRDYAMRGGK
jgi:hypothetical protein